MEAIAQNAPTPEQGVMFNAKLIEPGEIVGVAGPIKDMPFWFLEQTRTMYVVAPMKLGYQWTAKDLLGLSVTKLATHFKVLRDIKVLKTFTVLNANVHGITTCLRAPEQVALIDGTEMSDPALKKAGAGGGGIHSGHSHWRKMACGKNAYIKGTNDGCKKWNDNHREVLAYNLARLLDLGQYFPVVSIFKHPQTGKVYSAIEEIKGHHYGDIGKDREILRKLGDDGVLDKLALFDQIIYNTDRHRWNWMIADEAPFIKMIDHGLSLSPESGRNVYEPNYWQSYVGMGGDAKLHPAAVEWAKNIPVAKIREEIKAHKAPNSLDEKIESRAQKIKDAVTAKGNNISKRDAFFSVGGRY